MVGFGCASALLFDSESCVILRDTFTSLDVDSIQEEARVPTADVLAYVPYAGASSLDERVLRWVEGMAASWTASLPQERDGGAVHRRHRACAVGCFGSEGGLTRGHEARLRRNELPRRPAPPAALSRRALKPFDEMTLGAVLQRAAELHAAGERDVHFCELDSDLAGPTPGRSVCSLWAEGAPRVRRVMVHARRDGRGRWPGPWPRPPPPFTLALGETALVAWRRGPGRPVACRRR